MIEKRAYEIAPVRPAYLRPVSATIGKLIGSSINKRVFGKRVSSKLPDERKVRRLLQELEAAGYPIKDLKVYIGSHRPLDVWKRLLRNKRLSALEKIVYTMELPSQLLTTSLLNADLYHPQSNSVFLYSNIPGVLGHEVGHHIDLRNRSVRRIFRDRMRFAKRLRQELEATRIALAMLPPEERKKAYKYLEKAIATYGGDYGRKEMLTYAGRINARKKLYKELAKIRRRKKAK